MGTTAPATDQICAAATDGCRYRIDAVPLLVGWLLVGLGYLMPGHYPPWLSFESQALSALGVWMIGVATVRAEWTGPGQWRLLALPASAAALAIVPLVQLAAGIAWFTSDAVLAAAYLCAFAVAAVVGRVLLTASGATAVVALAWTLLFSALLSAAVALVQWQQLSVAVPLAALPPGGRPFGNLGQPNHQATLMALGLVALVYVHERRFVGGGTAALAAAFLGWALVMTQSRTGWVFVALFVAWWALQRRRAHVRLPGAVVAAAVVCFAAAVWAWYPINDALALGTGRALADRAEGGTRLIHWATMWDAAWSRPWGGFGWGHTPVAQTSAALNHPASGEWLESSHNLLLDLVVHNGLPVGVAVAVLLVAWFVHHVRACRSVEQWALIAAVGAVFNHAMFEYPLDHAYFLLPVGLMMGMLDAKAPFGRLALPLHRGVVALVVAALAAMLAWISVEYPRVEEAARQLRFRSIGLVLADESAADTPNVRLLDQPREFHRYALTPAREGMNADELEWMRRVAMRSPRPPVLLRYALASGINGRPDEAARTLRLICQLHPAERCDEGRSAWAQLQGRYAALRTVDFPDTPARLVR